MTITEKRYFHLVTDDEWEALKAGKLTWRGLQDEGYVQPDWCNYPDALDGMMGCWSLVGRKVTGEAYCKSCECYKAKVTA